MPKYSVILTRDVTESCVVEVEAADQDEASDLALEKLYETDDPHWALDDTPAKPDTYVTGWDLMVETPAK